jgi:hypothetical protein
MSDPDRRDYVGLIEHCYAPDDDDAHWFMNLVGAAHGALDLAVASPYR